MVQIEPVIPAVPAAAPVQEIGLKVTTLAPPVIAKLTPETGPVGTELHISGKNLWLKGLSTVVKVGGALIMDFVSAAENKIVITIPPDLKQGPEQGITVLVEGRESNPALFFVSPWITSIKPLRGAVDTGDPQALPIDIHGHGFQGAVQVSIGGVSVGSLDIVNENLIKTYVPNTLAKGHHIIDLQVDGNLANQRSFEVIE
ncbi:MAG: hypothetical protein GTO45_30910 [Candidatus Aminicenantes bacterium]|nr:hypothetical protein [Candidatus Aminicenantes bacterium]NIM81471.1 hypothetical protein [Candidatus Aminicenantes bacterium]NIN22579.1 hypothetical protein [Candidatus Aminicenantes bacterium]NIN44658.1 hypothetical protein [Candidatus Aminicenantes bacterium]NIN89189.1 hypothetical protein [Candidatus Aminicenantes bacterium]